MPPRNRATHGAGKNGTGTNGATSTTPSTDTAADGPLRTALREFVRTRGAGYLHDANVSSIGIGYKISDGRRTDDLAIQFTVAQKADSPEALEALDTTPLPASITVGGVDVPTDVLERTYEPAFQLVAEPTPVERKTRVDPVVPGVSVGNVHVTAGTLGAVVYDAGTGAPYLLSNWHVLHGPQGTIGDSVVQPGPHDDNRVDRNRIGQLVRSHLGPAGDCAVASLDDRAFAEKILGLDVVPDQLGEPDLDDKVIKSGRTTGVTRGIVRRVDTIVSIDYEGQGEQHVGGFEIGPDPDHPAPAHQISQGGDSGAVWLFVRDDVTRDGIAGSVMAGLHFGGESPGSDDDHALACLPASVFEKLEITLTPPTRAEAVAAATGYDADFLGQRVEVPGLGAGIRADVAHTVDGADTLDYTHFSLQMSASRRFAFWVAWNVDGSSIKKLARTGIEFTKDPRLDAKFQVGDEIYTKNRVDRGHIARRADLIWGPQDEADRANHDSFYFTNITPQRDDFNQSAKHGLWGELENAVFDEVDVDDLKISTFGGPVFAPDDRVYRGVALPREFWKVIAFGDRGELQARAFLLTQNLDQLEILELDEFRVYQVSLSEVEDRTGLRFPDALRKADTKAVTESLAGREPLAELTDIVW